MKYLPKVIKCVKCGNGSFLHYGRRGIEGDRRREKEEEESHGGEKGAGSKVWGSWHTARQGQWAQSCSYIPEG